MSDRRERMERMKPPVFSQPYTQRDKQEREGEKRERGYEIDNDGKECEGGGRNMIHDEQKDLQRQ